MIWIALIAAAHAALAPLVVRWLVRRGGSPRMLGLLALSWLVLGAGLWLLFRALELSIEGDPALLWAYATVAVTSTSFAAAHRGGRIPTAEILLAGLVVLEVALALAVTGYGGGGLASPPFRALVAAPAVLPLAAFFGASLGYLAGPGGATLRAGYETFIARRFLLSKASPVLSTVTSISVVGVALGVWLVIVSLGVLSGFEHDLERKIIGANAHLVLQARDGGPIEISAADTALIERAPGVVAASPVVEGPAAVSSSSNYTVALLFGVVPSQATLVLDVFGKIERGSLAPLEAELQPRPPAARLEEGGEFPPPAPLPRIVIGVEMAKGLNVTVGDRIRLISPMLETLTPLGPAPKSLGFEVAAVFASEMYDYDARYAFVSLPAARRFFELGDEEVTGVQVATIDPDTADLVGRELTARLGGAYEALDWKRRNQTLFAALKLERVVAFVVLVFIILVASFAIVNTLTMAVVEKKKEIAILKTMGARDGGIMRLFLTQGLVVGALGTLAGTLGAVGTVAALERFGFAIPNDVYYIDSLPVHLDGVDVVLVVLAALLIIWDFAVFPALRGSRLSPVEGLRDA